MKFRSLLLGSILTVASLDAVAGFGPVKVVDSLTVNRIYQGSGVTYVTFTGPALVECANNGGYLQPTWADANDGVINDAATARMLSVLLTAKSTGTKMEIRYKVNDAGSGWNNCAISGIYSY